MMCAAVVLAIAVVCHLSVRSVVLEEPWTPENEVCIPVHMIRRGLCLIIFGSTHQGSFDVSYEQVVMRPGLTFNQMNQLHDQLQQTQWASRFGSNVPKQYTPPVSVWGAARAVPPREGPGLTLNLAPVEQASPLQNDRPLISLGDAGRYENERFAQQEGEGRGGEWEERNGGSGGGVGEADNSKDGGRGQEEIFHARSSPPPPVHMRGRQTVPMDVELGILKRGGVPEQQQPQQQQQPQDDERWEPPQQQQQEQQPQPLVLSRGPQMGEE